jgi:tripartite-type tricarboxylate transporter receptor subunit TctC
MQHPIRLSAVAAAFAFACSSAWGQNFPSRSITVIVPFSPGNGVDIAARALAPSVSKRLGQPVVIENRTGASTAIGTGIVAKAKPDGHTILLTAGSIISDAAVHHRDDPIKEFAPVVLLTKGMNCFIVGPKTDAKSVKEIEAMARANPGKLFYSSGGTGVVHHLAMALFESVTGTDITHVPHKGAAEALQSVVAGRTEMMVLPVAAANATIRAGQVRMLAVLSPTRSKLYPDVPTMPELGYPTVTYESYYLVLAPAGTPAPVVTRLNTEYNAALRDALNDKTLDKMGLDLGGGTPEDLAALLREELVKMRKLVAVAKIQAE